MEFTSSTLLASVEELLQQNGYRLAGQRAVAGWDLPTSKLFEDPYSLVAVVVFDTWRELLTTWPDAQALLVDTMSAQLSKTEAKSWDAYLVLLTPSFTDTGGARDVNAIRYNTARVRKLIATGDELQTLEDVERTLLPLLPVATVAVTSPRDVLKSLVEALIQRGLDPDDVTQAVSAFSSNVPLMPALHRGEDED